MRSIAIFIFTLLFNSYSYGESPQPVSYQPMWWEGIVPDGDARIRYESIDEAGKSKLERETLQIRLGAKSKISESLDIGARIATDEKKDPTSRSTVLDHKFTWNNLIIDQVYLDWHPSFAHETHFISGRVPNPFIKPSDLLWDNDLTLDGISIFKADKHEDHDLFLNTGVYVLDQREAETDLSLYGVQGGSKFKNDLGSQRISIGFFGYSGAQGHTVTFNSQKPYGNTTFTEPNSPEKLLYGKDYQIFNLNADATFNAYLPVTLYADFIDNTATSNDRYGYMLGVRIGNATKMGDYSFNYNYRMLQRDSAIGKFTDSDSFGGGTNGKGNKISGEFYLTDHLKIQVSYFDQEKGLDSEIAYRRLQADLSIKL